MRLTAVTLLAENTIPILDQLCRYLTRETGTEIVAEDGLDERSADLVWACGYLMCDLIDSGRFAAEIVAAPVFAGQAGPTYHSVIVAGDPAAGSLADLEGRRLAINETVSWSGHHALVAHLAENGRDLSMFGDVVTTGSHRASIEAVADGTSDVASIDHTVWDFLAPTRPEAIRVIDRTQDWPAPPIAVRGQSPVGGSLRSALLGMPSGSVPGIARLAPATIVDYRTMTTT